MIKKKPVEKRKNRLDKRKVRCYYKQALATGEAEKPASGKRKGLTRVVAMCYYVTPR
jgi:hypothetical protein